MLETSTHHPSTFEGLQKFLNYLLFDNILPPSLINNEYYLLGEYVQRRFRYDDDNPDTADAKWGMNFFENMITAFSFEHKYKNVRKEIIITYENSPAKDVINDLIAEQMKAYIDNITPENLNHADVKFAFVETLIVPLQIKAFLTNHFADLFQEFDPEKKIVSKIVYDNLLKKYLRYKTLSEIDLNKGIGIHNQTCEFSLAPDESQRKAFMKHKLYKIKSRIKD